SKDHNFLPGEIAEKQIIVINNSRETVTCDCDWELGLSQPVKGSKRIRIITGQPERLPLRFELPATIAPGEYQLRANFKFSNGETQTDSFSIHVLPLPVTHRAGAKVALFDPKGETALLLNKMGFTCQTVDAGADISLYDILIVGKAALTVN